MVEHKATKQSIRPTKKQRELLDFIETFIAEHGYSPSYREIMSGQNYTSVATVATHVNSLVKRGHLIKREHAARSLEVVRRGESEMKVAPKQLNETEEKWLVDKIALHFKDIEERPSIALADLDNLYVLIGALKVLQLEGAANAYMARLSELKKRIKEDTNYAT